MYYPNEVREVPEYANLPDMDVKEKEIQLAEQLVKSLATEFDSSKYEDRYQQRVFQLIEAKAEGRKEVVATPSRRVAPVINLMEALERSLSARKKEPKRAEAAPARRKRAS